ncbi:hypothetical protein D3C85_1738100 [compost metagenome]
MKPQCNGIPMWCTTWPLTCSGRMRLVTTATASMKPRLELTRTLSPATMPFSLASTSPISTNCSGWEMALSLQCLLQKWKCSVNR